MTYIYIVYTANASSTFIQRSNVNVYKSALQYAVLYKKVISYKDNRGRNKYFLRISEPLN